MPCLGDNTLVDYLELRLPPAEVHELFVHVDGCEACARLLAEAAGSFTSELVRGGAPTVPAGAPALPRERGSLIGRYVVDRVIGFGGMGVVYAARDPELDRLVAVKLLRPDLAGDPETKRALVLREAQAMARLSHPNVITIYEVGTFEDRVFIAMEYVDGTTLRAWLRSALRPWREVLRAFTLAGGGLQAAHEAGLVHRDFKPDNVLVADNGRICVTDFGVALRVSAEAPAADDAPARARTAALAGTPRYMSPEQLAGGSVDPRTDVFSFCVALHEALFGVRPFAGESLVELRHSVAAGVVRPPPGSTRVPARLRRVLLAGLRVDPAARPASMRQLVDELTRSARPRAPRRLAAAAGLALAVGVGMVVLRAPPARPVGPQSGHSAALLALADRGGAPDTAWLSTAIGEIVGVELHVAGGPRVVPGDEVVRVERELRIAPAEELSSEALATVRDDLRADYLVTGSYVAGPGDALGLTLHLYDAASGRVMATAEETGDQRALSELASRAGARLRAGVGMAALGTRERDTTLAALPSRPDAARAYARGLYHKRMGNATESRLGFEEAARLEPEHAFSHVQLARALKQLGFDRKAREEARRGFELASHLEREDQLGTEAYFREVSNEWDRAIELGRALVTFFPDRTDYALRLAGVQSRARRGPDCLATIAALRKLPLSDPQDPAIDLSEAWCADAAADYRRVQSLTDRAAAEAERRGARLLMATARYLEGRALDRLGQLDRALAYEDAAQNIFHAYSDRAAEAGALLAEGIIYADRGEARTERPLVERAVALYREVGYRNGELFALNALAIGSTPTEARPLFKQAIAIAIEIDDNTGLCAATMNLALIDAGEGEVRPARGGLDEALAISRRAGDHNAEASVQENLCQLLHRAGDPAAALAACLDAETLWAATGEAGMARVDLGFSTARVRMDQARLADAEAATRHGLEQARALKSPALEAAGESTLAEALRRQGRLADATLAVERARALWKQASDPELRVAIEIEGGRVAAATPARDQARPALAQAVNDARTGGWVQDLRDARLALGELDWRAGRRGTARTDLEALANEARTAGDLYIVHEVEAILRR